LSPAAATTALHDAARAEAVLRVVIEEAQAGLVDYDRMEPDIVPSVRAAQAGVIAQLRRFGPVAVITPRGKPAGGKVRIYKFDVQHARGRSKWRISLGASGRISNLLFQPA
jgi:hypothetical protein